MSISLDIYESAQLVVIILFSLIIFGGIASRLVVKPAIKYFFRQLRSTKGVLARGGKDSSSGSWIGDTIVSLVNKIPSKVVGKFAESMLEKPAKKEIK